MYGLDWDGPPVHEANDTVTVPDTLSPLLPHEISLLQTLIDPLQPCDDLGVSMYGATRQFVRDIVDQRH